jgi:hypothetical protein
MGQERRQDPSQVADQEHQLVGRGTRVVEDLPDVGIRRRHGAGQCGEVAGEGSDVAGVVDLGLQHRLGVVQQVDRRCLVGLGLLDERLCTVDH